MGTEHKLRRGGSTQMEENNACDNRDGVLSQKTGNENTGTRLT